MSQITDFIEDKDIVSPFGHILTSMFLALRRSKQEDAIPISLGWQSRGLGPAADNFDNGYYITFEYGLRSIYIGADTNDDFEVVEQYLTKMFGARKSEEIHRRSMTITWSSDGMFEADPNRR